MSSRAAAAGRINWRRVLFALVAPVGALVFSDKIDHVVPPAKGRSHALRVIREALGARPRG